MRSKTVILAVALAAAVLAACTNKDAAKQRYVENGDRFASQGKYAEAIVEYRNAVALDDKFGRARAKLGEAYAASNNPEGAYREYQRAADLLPDDIEVQKRAAILLFMAGQFEDVRTRAEVVLRKNPKDVDAQILLANAMVGLRDLEGGIRQIEEAIELDPEHAATYTNLGLLKVAQNQAEAAEAAFQKAVDLDPKSLKARLALAYYYLSTANVAKAETTLNQALAIDPNDAMANRVLAALYVATGRQALAEKPLKLIVDVTRSPQAKLALAEYYARTRRVPMARAILEPMVRDAASYPDAQTQMAILAYQGGDRAAATKLLDEVLTKVPGHAKALQVRARWHLAEGQTSQALERARMAVSVAPRDAGAFYLFGLVQSLTGQPEAAVTSFNNVLRLNPRAAAAQVQLSQLRLQQGQTEQALGLANEAVASAPNVPEARLVLARALVAERDFARAEVEINQLLRVFPRSSAVHALRGTLLLLKGDRASARTAYQQAFDLSPSSIAAITGLSMLDLEQNQVATARARIERRLEAEPNRPALLIVAAKIFVADKDLTKAESALRSAIELSPNVPEPYTILADLYHAQNRVGAAQMEFDALARGKAANTSAATMAAVLIDAQGNHGEAKQRYAAILAADPRASIAANNLAWIYAEEKQNLDNALDLAQRTTEELPEYANAWDTLGWVYYRKQLPLLAIAPLEKAVAKDPGNVLFRHHLGLALTAGGDRARAREAFLAALKIQPDFKDAQQQLKALD